VLTCIACGAKNPEGFRLCGMCGASLATPLPERRKLATLLFCDMSGSTAMGERIDAESLRAIKFRYFQTMRSELEGHGGTVEKFIGDAVVAIFGVPTAHEDDALRAVRAAMKMRGRLAELNAELEERFGLTIALRMGVNTGEVVTGEPSTAASLVTGDAVNVAARLEQAAPIGEILLGDLTYRLVRHAVSVDRVGPIALKGKAQPVPAYRLVSILPGAPALARRFESPFVGREDELRALERLFSQALRKERCLLAPVVGQPGVGKSRLVDEFSARVVDRATVLAGSCLSYGEGITFWPLVEIVRQIAGVRDGDSPADARARIGRLTTPEVAERIAAVVGLGGEIASEELGWAVRRLFEELARERPLLLIVDDAHWAEATLLDVLEQVSKNAAAPILLLCLARPELLEVRSVWEPAVRVEPLSETDAGDLVRGMAERFELPVELEAKVGAASAGNPLFAEELSILLSEDPDAKLPVSLGALLTARLDRLPEDGRAAAERASVEGEVFQSGAVVWLSPEEARPRVIAALDGLVKQELIRPAPAEFAAETAFRFKHGLVRDTAYHGISKKLRAELHERFAVWLERIAGPRVIEYEEILGYHLEQAHRYLVELGPRDERGYELARRAAEWLAPAGQRAAARGDVAATMNLLSRAAALLPPDNREHATLLVDLANTYLKVGEFELAGTTAGQAGEEALLLNDPALRARSSIVRLQVRWYIDPGVGVQDLQAEATQAIETLAAVGDNAGLAEGWTFSAYLLLAEGQAARMEEAIGLAIEFAERAGNRKAMLDALFLAPMINWFGPRPRQEGIERCRELLERSGGARHVDGYSLVAWGLLEAMGGDLDEGRRLVEQGEEMLSELGMGVLGLPQSSGYLELMAGDPATAEGILRPSFERLRELGETSFFSGIASLLAEVVYRQGRHEEALELAEVTRQALQPDDAAQADWRTVRARVLARRGQWKDVDNLIREAVEIIDRTDFLQSRAFVRCNAAEALRLAGHLHEAAALLREAVALFEVKGDIVEARWARAELVTISKSGEPSADPH
jgi:class 3 adenylate cyclase/tetratricopeptide (TPR) repeat protein